MITRNWQKSSYSGNAANCLYVAAPGEETVLLRESEQPDVVLTTTPARLTRLLAAVKNGALDVGE
ncbi:DUF397 domain-containing protein [Streptomyces iconiensis]|uniref:DUF397 domain-containing protein n=1 Tax=Streptomyces iconiensis TaxID=1384038 RepID=A0ABT6ZY39_9ACTN|nr:DUF397 domain-containing protein [Streptomyces iconiensis]MDJ1133767.1 DUF397 domain-containing protein [Streptomyces iconiensis]